METEVYGDIPEKVMMKKSVRSRLILGNIRILFFMIWFRCGMCGSLF